MLNVLIEIIDTQTTLIMLVIKRKKAIIHMIIFVSPVTKIVETEKKTTTEKTHKHIHFNWRISGALILPKVK
jgi:hypothetical protein